MGFEGEFAKYEPLRRILDSEKIREIQKRFKVRTKVEEESNFRQTLTMKSALKDEENKPQLILSIDGSLATAKAENGYPGAEFGYVTVASVLIDLKKVNEASSEDFINPRRLRETEDAYTIDSVFPGCNVILDEERSAKASLRKALFEEFQNNRVFTEGESLLETYEYLLKRKMELGKDRNLPKSPIEDYEDNKMEYEFGVYSCPYSGEPLYSTDALRLHELMNPAGSNGEMFGQIMSTLEKLWLVHILRGFEKLNLLATLGEVAFIMDGPLAVFSTSSWLTKVIIRELRRINESQKKKTGVDMLIMGVEKSGTFCNHFEDLDTPKSDGKDIFPNESALLLTDDYIKEHIIFSKSKKPYGKDTYFGRKFFYKTRSGQRIVAVAAFYTSKQQALSTAEIRQFPRLKDIMNILDDLASSRYPNSISPLISAHAEAAIPLNLGKKLLEGIAKKIRKEK